MVSALNRLPLPFLAAGLVLVIGLAACSQAPQSALDAYPWLYQPEPAPASQDDAVEIIAVGDILLGRGVQTPDQAFQDAAPWLQAADLTLGNLECVLVSDPITPTTTLDHSTPPPVRLFASPEAAGWLRKAGFDLLGLANNHALDAGQAGLAESAAHLQSAGLSIIGAGPTQADALQPALLTIKDVRIALFAINAIPIPPDTGQDGPPQAPGLDIARWDRALVQQAVQQARARADVVIISIHWGYEYQARVDPAQERFAQVLLTSGADVVIGHHPHVIQQPEILVEGGRTRLVAYSLGNFVFDQGQGDTGRGLALRLLVDRHGLRAAQALPVLAGSRPTLQDPPPAPEAAVLPTAAAFTCSGQSCTPLTPPPCPVVPGIFQSGRADLDADGILEEIQLEAGRLTILHAAETAWTSPPQWQVVDAALGDPDQDGRADLLAIFWKADRAGVLRSHPFLIRSEGGRYQEVWGGSAVSEPILEAGVGDLDGDGLDELVVIEQSPLGKQSLSVWSWHGWGFSQVWRSAPGDYQDLALLSPTTCRPDGPAPLILTVSQ